MAKTDDEKAKPLADYWVHGEGAAKIRWGESGDFDRCVTEVTKAAPGLSDVKGYCAERHHDALGVWPGQEDKPSKAARLTAALRRRVVQAAELSKVTIPALVTIPGVEICATGEWGLSTGPATFTKADFAAAVEASQCPAVGSPVLKLGHVDERFDGEPAVGRVTNMTLAAEGNKLAGDFTGMPGWLGVVLASAYPGRSVEGYYQYACSIGHLHPFVISAVALLGVATPGVGVLNSLQDVAQLWGVAAGASGVGLGWKLEEPMTAPVQAQGVTVEDVRRQYYAIPANGYSMWIAEIQLDPPQLIVCNDDDSSVYRVPLKFGNDGTVTFGDPVQVAVEYVDVPAKTAASAVFASAAESRAGIGPAKPAGGEPADDPEVSAADSTSDDADAATSDQHGPMTGSHSHPHSAYGSQGGDSTHDHAHSHTGDANHEHAHATASVTNQEGATVVDFTDEQLTALRGHLGIEGDVTPDALVTAAGAMHDRAEAVRATGGKLNIPVGAKLVDQGEWDALHKRVEDGEKFRTRTLHNERDSVIDACIKAGKFGPARRATYVRMWDADPDAAREVLASLAPNVVPVSDRGTAAGEETDETIDREFAGLYPPGSYK